jgi:hypothetical protein
MPIRYSIDGINRGLLMHGLVPFHDRATSSRLRVV